MKRVALNILGFGCLLSAVLQPTPSAAQQQTLAPTSNLSAEDRATFRKEVRAYLLEHPEVIFEAIQILEARRNQTAQDAEAAAVLAHANALSHDGFSWVGGNINGDVTVVEFSDYRCGFCKKAHPVIEELLERDPNVRLVIKEFPILGPDSVAAGRLALAALALDASKYRALNNAMMAYQGNLTEQVAYRIATSVGYDIAELKELAASDVISERLQKNYDLAGALRLEGTPSFVVGTEIIRGFLPIEDMIAAVVEARAAGN